MKLNPPQTAPKNMDVFLGLFEGYPSLVSASWNPHVQVWVYTHQNRNIMNGEYTGPYFETEWVRETAIIGWLPMPSFEL